MFAAVYLYAFPYFGQLRSANELPRVLMTQEIVERGTFRLDARMGELGSWFDIAPTPDRHYYSNKAPGASLLAVPAYVALKAAGKTSTYYSTWAFRLTVVIVPALVFLFFFYRLARRFSSNESAVRLGLVAFAFASPAMPYALVFMSHMPAAVTAGGAFYAAVALVRGEARRPALAALVAGALGATSVMMDYQSFIAALWVGLYVLVRSRRRVRDTALVLAGTVPPGALLAFYHQVSFGSPFKTGYDLSNVVHEQGFLGLVGPSHQAFWHTLLDPSNGLLVLAPWMALSVVGFIVIVSRREARGRAGAEAIVCLLVLASYLLFMGSLVPSFSRAGWCVGPRYMTVALPFAAWLAVAGFDLTDRFLPLRVAAKGAVLASAVIFVAAATTYPHWPERFANPLYELTFRLLADGYAVHSIGTALGMSGLASLLPLYTFAAAIALWLLSGHRRRVIGAALACAVAVGIVSLHRRFPGSGAYADHAYGYITSTWEPRARSTPRR
jgi:hypothetical protein